MCGQVLLQCKEFVNIVYVNEFMFLSDVHTHTHTLQEDDTQVFANIQHLYQDTIDSLIVGDLIEHPITDIQGVITLPANSVVLTICRQF